ncbi:MAG TPA: type II secretion system protein GspM [Stellaceae bacterium]|nr:type II secretion system protein GspM [Stellaceae bacterium]
MTRARAAALLILLALLAGLWVGPVAAYRGLVDGGARRLAAAEQKLSRYRALLHAPHPTAMPIDATAALFPANSAAQADALLQQALKTAAAAAQVEIEGLQVLQPEAVDGATRIGIRLKGRADIAALDHLLYAIEASPRLLYPDNLQIETRMTGPAAAAGPLEFQVDVSGFKPGPRT